MATQAHGDFLDSGAARLLAAAIALLLAVVVVAIWYDDLEEFAFWRSPNEAAIEADLESANRLSAAQQSCFESRQADIDAMRNQGVIDDRQYELFSQRAEDLCRAQND